MKNRTLILSTVVLAVLISGCSKPKKDSMDFFIDNLMSKMTLEEKIGQLNLPVAGTIITGQAQSSDVAGRIKAGQVGGLFNLKGAAEIREIQKIAVDSSRLGIPLLFGMDVIHGYETCFPIPLGLSCTWDMDAIEESARIAAEEASSDGISWTFSPMVDISRDPRWGRVSEGSGEDPYLGSEIAKAMIRGYQGHSGEQFVNENQIMACVKHFALYGGAEAGKDYNTVDMSRQRMFNEYFPPYKAAIDAGAGSVMASFNVVDFVPATVNEWLMTVVLRNQWGFDGFVVTDYTGIQECVPHGAGTFHEVAIKALKAGVDMDMVSEAFLSQLSEAVRNGEISDEYVDKACRRILEAKYKLKLFQNPYRYCREDEAKEKVYCAEHRAKARKISGESYVLLKNEPFKGKRILPLAKSGTVAVIGPLANTGANMVGTWSVAANHSATTSVIDGFREVLGDNVKFLYAKGSNICSDIELEKRSTMFGRDVPRDNRTDKQMIDEAVAVAMRSDVVIAALGEPSEMSGESSSRTDISIPDVQKQLLKALLDTGKPIVLALFDGRPLAIEWESNNIPAILNVWFGGTETAYSLADVLFGDVNPSGKLTMSFPRSVGQIPLYYAHCSTGRPTPYGTDFAKFTSCYLDSPNTPVYPFGHGLSYTQFSYGTFKLSSDKLSKDSSITATVNVTNSGDMAGKEVVQMYIQDVAGSVSRPVRELKGFSKILLNPGESKTVEFKITPDMLAFWNQRMEFGAENGAFEVFIGGDSTTSNKAGFILE